MRPHVILFLLIFLTPNAKACEGDLGSAYIRLFKKGLEEQILSHNDLARAIASSEFYDPLADKTPESRSASLKNGFARVIHEQRPSWDQVRIALRELVTKSEETRRGAARASHETRRGVNPQLVDAIETNDALGLSYFTNAKGEVTLAFESRILNPKSEGVIPFKVFDLNISHEWGMAFPVAKLVSPNQDLIESPQIEPDKGLRWNLMFSDIAVTSQGQKLLATDRADSERRNNFAIYDLNNPLRPKQLVLTSTLQNLSRRLMLMPDANGGLWIAAPREREIGLFYFRDQVLKRYEPISTLTSHYGGQLRFTQDGRMLFAYSVRHAPDDAILDLRLLELKPETGANFLEIFPQYGQSLGKVDLQWVTDSSVLVGTKSELLHFDFTRPGSATAISLGEHHTDITIRFTSVTASDGRIFVIAGGNEDVLQVLEIDKHGKLGLQVYADFKAPRGVVMEPLAWTRDSDGQIFIAIHDYEKIGVLTLFNEL